MYKIERFRGFIKVDNIYIPAYWFVGSGGNTLQVSKDYMKGSIKVTLSGGMVRAGEHVTGDSILYGWLKQHGKTFHMRLTED